MTVILQKKNFFQVTNKSHDVTPLLNRIVIFSVTEMFEEPVVSPLRVGILQADGIKLRHDFMLSADESQ